MEAYHYSSQISFVYVIAFTINARVSKIYGQASNKKRRVAERLALPTSGHGVAGSNPTGGEILPEPKRRFIAQSLSCSSFHRLKMTEILLKGRKTLTHPSKPRISLLCKQILVYLYDLLSECMHYTRACTGKSGSLNAMYSNVAVKISPQDTNLICNHKVLQ